VGGIIPQRMGNAHLNVVPYQVFTTQDGHIVLAVGNDGPFERFCKVAGDPGLARDPRFAVNANRVRNRATLVPLLEPLMRQRSRADWLVALEQAKVPCGPINDLADVFADPQVIERGMRVPVPHPLTDKLHLVASPMKLSKTPVALRQAPPLLGQHTDQVLARLGLDPDERLHLRALGVLGPNTPTRT
jgi:crotonobetainyl-CoA:carnitine CoA-transferase CaiB-like acyl-CoA transferase